MHHLVGLASPLTFSAHDVGAASGITFLLAPPAAKPAEHAQGREE
jgi:cysteine sulfinate desulfinase/cysteine desulfurase-like protein